MDLCIIVVKARLLPSIDTIITDKDTIVLESYKKNLSMSDNYIRNKDKKAIEEFKEKFKE